MYTYPPCPSRPARLRLLAFSRPLSVSRPSLAFWSVCLLLLTLSVAASANPQVPQGGSASFADIGMDAPTYDSNWDIINSAGQMVATNAAPNGWTAVYRPKTSQFTVSAPASALVAPGYEVRYLDYTFGGDVSAFFDVVGSGGGGGGASLSGLTLSPTTVIGAQSNGTPSTGTVTLSAAASTDTIVSLSSSNTSLVTLPPTVTVPAGSASKTFPITAGNVTSQTTVQISATYGGTTLPQTLAVNPWLAALSLSSNSVAGGATVTGTITLNAPAPTGGLSVTVASSNSAAPIPGSTVVVPAGQTSTTFSLTTQAVTSTTTGSITAAYSGVTLTQNLDVQPLSPNLQATSLDWTPVNPIAGNQVSFSAVIQNQGTATAFANHWSVEFEGQNLGNGEPAWAAGPVDLAPGQSVTVNGNATWTAVPGTYIVLAVINDSYRSLGKTLIVTSATPAALVSLTVNPTSAQGGAPAQGGTPVTGTVTLNGPALPGGEVVRLSSGDPSTIVPPTVTVLAGQTSANFPVTTVPVVASTSVTLSASYHGVTVQAGLTVLPNPTLPGTGSQTMALTPAGIARGFKLTTFADKFPTSPTSSAVTSSGSVLVSSFPVGNSPSMTYIFPSDTDGQDASTVKSTPNGMFILATTDGNTIYGSYEAGSIFRVSPDGTKSLPLPNVSSYRGIAVNPVNGHLLSATSDIDPVADTEISIGRTDAPDGVAISPDGQIGYVVQYSGPSHIYGFDLIHGSTNKPPILDSGLMAGNPDGVAAGSGILNGKVYANTNDGHIVEVDFNTNPPTQTVIASGGSRGDLASVDQTNGTFLISQSDAILRLTPPPGGTFGSTPTDRIITRDDATTQYAPFQNPVTQNPDALSTQAAAFDATGLQGSVLAARMQRAGSFAHDSASGFDLQWGVQSTATGSLASFGDPLENADALPSPSPYADAWDLPTSFLPDVQAGLGQTYRLTLADALSSISAVSGPLAFTDTPQSGFPAAKNALTFLLAETKHQVPQGRSQDFTLFGTDAPLNGAWDIAEGGVLLASSGNRQGWNVEDDHTPYHGILVTVPTGAAVGTQYEARFAGGASGSVFFDVTAAGSSPSAPVLLPLFLHPHPIAGGASVQMTVALDAPAPAGGATIALTSSNPAAASLAPSVTIPAGSLSATVPITTTSVPATTSVSFQASYNGTRQVWLTVYGPDGNPTASGPVDPSGNPIDTSGFTGGANDPGGGSGTTVTRQAPAAPTGLVAVGGDGVVNLSWGEPAGQSVSFYVVARQDGAGLPPYHIVFWGTTQTSYADAQVQNGTAYTYIVFAVNGVLFSLPSNTATATPHSTTGDFGIAASPGSLSIADGSSSQSSLSLTPQSGFVGAVQLSISDVADPNGSILGPTSDPTKIAAVFNPATVNLDGTDTAASSLTLTAGAQVTPGTYSLQVTGYDTSGTRVHSVTVNVNVIPSLLSGVRLDKSAVKAGDTGIGTVTLNEPAPAGGAKISLSSSDSAISLTADDAPIMGPATLTIQANQSSANFSYKSNNVKYPTDVTVSAEYNNTTSSTMIDVYPAIDLTAIASGSQKITLYWRDTGASYYNIYRSQATGGPYTKINSSPVNTLDPGPGLTNTYVYTDTDNGSGLTTRVQYFYYVVTVDSTGTEGLCSNEDSATPDGSAIPWDTNDPEQIVASVSATAALDLEPDDDGTGDTISQEVGVLQIAAPDGVVYMGNFPDGSPAQAYAAPGYSSSGVMVSTDGTTVAAPNYNLDSSDDSSSVDDSMAILERSNTLKPFISVGDYYPYSRTHPPTGIFREVQAQPGYWGVAATVGIPDASGPASSVNLQNHISTSAPGSGLPDIGRSYPSSGDIYSGGYVYFPSDTNFPGGHNLDFQVDAGLQTLKKSGAWTPIVITHGNGINPRTYIDGSVAPLPHVHGWKTYLAGEVRMQFITPDFPHVADKSVILHFSKPVTGIGTGFIEVAAYDQIDNVTGNPILISPFYTPDYVTLVYYGVTGWRKQPGVFGPPALGPYDNPRYGNNQFVLKRMNSIAQVLNDPDPTAPPNPLNPGAPIADGPPGYVHKGFLMDGSSIASFGGGSYSGTYWGDSGDSFGIELYGPGGGWQSWTDDSSLTLRAGAYPGPPYVNWLVQNAYFWETNINLYTSP